MTQADIDRDVEQLRDDAERLAESVRRDFPNVDADAVESAATFAIAEAIDKYDASRGEFVNYARWLMARRVVDALRSAERDADRAADACDAAFITAYREPSPSGRADAVEFWKVATRGLTKRHSLAVQLVHREGLTHAEAAGSLGVDRVRVTQLITEAEPTLRRNLGFYLAC